MIEHDEELSRYNKRGLIVGPHEELSAFLARARGSPPVQRGLQEAFPITQALFDITPDWIEIDYSNRALAPWQAAAVWTGKDSALRLQLRTSLQKGSYFKIYSREEILAHEAVHAARAAFYEPRFEEIFAYTTAKSAFRRFWGPLFRSTWEPYVFLGILLITLGLEIFVSPLFVAILGIPLCVGALRLMRAHTVLKRCLKNLEKLLPRPQEALAVAMRLTDQEIAFFSKEKPEVLLSYIQTDSTLRWSVLRKEYFYEDIVNLFRN